jgi:hypothetical protein
MASVGATVSAWSLRLGETEARTAVAAGLQTTEAWPGVTFSNGRGLRPTARTASSSSSAADGSSSAKWRGARGGAPCLPRRPTLLSPGYDKGHGGLVAWRSPAFGQNGRFSSSGTGTGNPAIRSVP